MNITIIVAAVAIVIPLCVYALTCARREEKFAEELDKKMENIHRRLKELEGKKKEG